MISLGAKWRRTAFALAALFVAGRLFRGGPSASELARSAGVIPADEARSGGGSGGNVRRVPGRQLLSTIDGGDFMSDLDSDSVRAAALIGGGEGDQEPADANGTSTSSPPGPLPPYTLGDAVREAVAWEHTFAVVVYDPESDAFIGHYSGKYKRSASCKKLWNGVMTFASALRVAFPERFRGGAGEEIAFAVGSGDYPYVKLRMLPRGEDAAPVLQFGSVFRDRGLYPSMIAMPMPGHHLSCFEEWARSRRVCGRFRSVMGEVPHGELVFGDDLHLEWDNLIPQVIWRGSDFGFLPTLQRPKLSKPLANHIESAVKKSKTNLLDKQSKKIAATRALRENYDKLLPRWKGVVLTAEAEVEVDAEKSQSKLPWADIRFSRFLRNGMMPSTVGSREYREYEEVGIAVGNFMARPDMAKYRYHIDLGGGGGTTWTGTLEKIAMPGLLFHHVTPTRDYIHSRLRPWRHYVPVLPDLRDLREKFAWAEGHPLEARGIARQATELVRRLGTPEGFGAMFEEDFSGPVRRVMEAYQPVSSAHPGRRWQDVVEEAGMEPVIRCSGQSNDPASCRYLGDYIPY